MLKGYITIALRHMIRQKGYSLINVLGLAIGMVCCILIFLYVQDELSYDRYHDKADRIYRVVANNDVKTPPAMAPALKADFPEVEQYVRMLPTSGTWVMKYEENIFYEKQVYWVDDSIFEVFSFPLVKGDPATALTDPFSVVISEATAEKYFGDEDPMGKTIIADNGFAALIVTGIMKNLPANTHFKADFFVSMATSTQVWGSTGAIESWNWLNFYIYLVLAEGADPAALEAKFPAFVDKYIGAQLEERGARFEPYLQSVPDIHLYSHLDHEPGANSDIAYVYILSAIAAFTLIIACINFMNLSTARFANRAREVGLRKVLGAYRSQLMQQFLGESVLMTLAALLLALAAVWLIFPAFNEFTGKSLTIGDALQPARLIGLLIGTILVGLLAGSYPALFLSAFQPSQTLKGSGRSEASRGLFRKILVIIQFAISIVFIVGTGILFQQMDYIQHKNLGFDREQVIVIPTFQAVAQTYRPWKRTILQHAGVLSVTQGMTMPGMAGNIGQISTGTIRRIDEPGDTQHAVQGLAADVDYVETLGLQLLSGRTHTAASARDTERESIVINEAAMRVLGWDTPEEAIDQQVKFRNDTTQTIIGVVRDFHLRSLHQPIEPLVLMLSGGLHIAVRLQPAGMRDTLAYIEQTWDTFFPDFPMAYTFIDDDINRLYQTEARISYVFGAFALMAVLIACLGLFALASYTAELRTKEIGVRKVLGASVNGVVLLLSSEFVKLVLIANVIAWPVAYLVMQRWLQTFAYQVDIGPGIFLLSGVMALIITLATVSYHAVKTARVNPVDALRNE